MGTSLVPVATDEEQGLLQVAEGYFRELDSTFVPSAEWRRRFFSAVIRDPDSKLCWILSEGQRVGFVVFGVQPHRFLPRSVGVIYELFVLPDFRRRAIATQTANLVIGELEARSVVRVQLEVINGNETAMQFWQGLGFGSVAQRLIRKAGTT